MNATHTVARLAISRAAFQEIRTKLFNYGYADAIQARGGKVVIDMTGLALEEETCQVHVPGSGPYGDPDS